MDININIWQTAFSHVIVSIVPWIIAVLAGGALGYILAITFRSWIRRSPGIFFYSAIFPWRSIAALISLIAITYPWIQMRYGLGDASGIFSMGIILIAWSVPCTMQAIFQHWFETTLRVRMVSTYRMLAIVSIAITAITLHGTGYMIIYAGLQNLNDAITFQGYALTGGILLIVDLILGFIQFWLSRLKTKKESESHNENLSREQA